MIRSKKVALSRMEQKYGKAAWVRDRGGSSSTEARAWASAERQRYPKPEAPDLNKWPSYATIGEFRAAREKWAREQKAWKKRDDELFSQAVRYRYEVGKDTGLGFGQVLGSGDTWDEALAKAGVK